MDVGVKAPKWEKSLINMVKYIVYQTTCLVNNKIYIGVHKTHTPDKFDGYLGCDVNINFPITLKNPKWPLQYAIKKYGYKNFRRTTIKEFDSAEEAYKLEAELVTKEFISRKDTYNACPGGIGGASFCRMVKVYQYDLDGNFIAEHESTWSAVWSIDPECKTNHIARAIKLHHQYMGFQWSYEYIENMGRFEKNPSYERKLTECKPIGKYSLETGELIESYPYLRACVQAGYKNVKQVLLGKRKSCKGYTFKYLDKD